MAFDLIKLTLKDLLATGEMWIFPQLPGHSKQTNWHVNSGDHHLKRVGYKRAGIIWSL